MVEKVIEGQHKGKHVSFYLNNDEISVFAEPKKYFKGEERLCDVPFHIIFRSGSRKGYNECMEYLEELIKEEEKRKEKSMFKLGKVLHQLMNMNKELEETRKEIHAIADSLGCHETFPNNYDVRLVEKRRNGKAVKVKVGFSLPHDAWEELEKSEAWNKVLKFLQEKKEATLL